MKRSAKSKKKKYANLRKELKKEREVAGGDIFARVGGIVSSGEGGGPEAMQGEKEVEKGGVENEIEMVDDSIKGITATLGEVTHRAADVGLTDMVADSEEEGRGAP